MNDFSKQFNKARKGETTKKTELNDFSKSFNSARSSGADSRDRVLEEMERIRKAQRTQNYFHELAQAMQEERNRRELETATGRNALEYRQNHPLLRQNENDAAEQYRRPGIGHAAPGTGGGRGHTPTFLERVGDTLESGLFSRASGDIDTAATISEGNAENNRNIRAARNEIAENAGGGFWGNLLADLAMMPRSGNPVADQVTLAMQSLDDSYVPALHDLADDLSDKAAMADKRAKQDLGWLGQQAVNMGSSGINMLIDRAETAIAPGLGLVAMGLRSYGNSAGEARREGASVDKQMIYGLANAAVEVGSEMLGDLPGVYGGGWLDDAVMSVVNRWNASPTLRGAAKTVASALGESIEELAAGIIEPGLKAIYNDKTLKENYQGAGKDIRDAMFVGGVMGALGFGTQSGIRSGVNYINDSKTGSAFTNMGDGVVRAIVDEGLDSAPDTDSYRLAVKNLDRLNAGKKLTANQVGKQYNANVSTIEEEAKQNGQIVKEYTTETVQPVQEAAPENRLQQLAMEMADKQVKAMQPVPAFPYRQAATVRPARQNQNVKMQATQQQAQQVNQSEQGSAPQADLDYAVQDYVENQIADIQEMFDRFPNEPKGLFAGARAGFVRMLSDGTYESGTYGDSSSGFVPNENVVRTNSLEEAVSAQYRYMLENGGDEGARMIEKHAAKAKEADGIPAQKVPTPAYDIGVEQRDNGTFTVAATDQQTGDVQRTGSYATASEAETVAASMRQLLADDAAQQYNGNGKGAMNNGGQGNDGLRPGSGRLYAQRSGEQAGGVSGAAAQTAGERGAGAQNVEIRQGNGGKIQRQTVQAETLIPNAKPGQTLFTFNQPETDDHRTGAALAKQNGISNVTFFEANPVGVQHKEAGIIRAWHKADGSIGVQTNNREVSAADLTRHEIMEHKLDTGELTADQVLDAAEQYVDREMLDDAIQLYYDHLLPDGDVSEEQRAEIYEHAKDELVCDGGDHINQLRYDVDHGNISAAAWGPLADRLDTVLDGLNRAANELTDNAFTLKEDAGTRYSGKLKGEDGNAKEQTVRRGELADDSRRVSGRSETGGRPAVRRGEGSYHPEDFEGARKHEELTEYEKERVDELLINTIESDSELSLYFADENGKTRVDNDRAKQIYLDILDGKPYIARLCDFRPDFADTIAEIAEFVTREKPTSNGPSQDQNNTELRKPSAEKDSDGNTISIGQAEKFQNSQIRDNDGKLLVVYHGSRFDLFTIFDAYNGIWVTPDIEYAKRYAENWPDVWGNRTGQKISVDLEGKEIEVYSGSGLRLYKLYADGREGLMLGEVNGDLNDTYIKEISDRLGVDEKVVSKIAKKYQGGPIYSLTRSRAFIKLALNQGFDYMQASEGGVTTYCLIKNPNQAKLTSNRVPTNDPDIRYSQKITSQDVGDAKVYNRTVVLKEDTVDKYLKDYASKSTPNYAQAYITYMTPKQFLDLTTSTLGRIAVSQETGELDLEQLKSATVDQPIQLNISDGEVVGHEGRHRATALDRAGIRKIPVLLFDSSNKYSKTAIDSITLTGQDFGRSRSYANVTVEDVQPLSYANRDVIIQKFATQPASERIAENYGRETVRFSQKITPQQDAINQSMTMEQARQMIQRAFVLGEIKEWYDGQYKNGDEWLRGEGAEAVALIVDNEYTLQQAYLNKIPGVMDGDFYAEDIIEAYKNGTLTGKEKKPTAKADLSQSKSVNDPRFYAPKQIENAKELYATAIQRLTKTNEKDVIAARAAILLYSHNKGASETLGITDAELNKKLRSWSNYSAKARDASRRINAGVQESNRWTGIENSAYAVRATVTKDELARMVGDIEGDGDGYQYKYIARTMLALDTHIDWTWLKFKFDTPAGVNAHKTDGSRCNGYYTSSNRFIHVKRDAPNTVAHEMGHALDDQWGRDVGLGGFLTQSSRNSAQISDDVRPWFDRFHEFCDTLVDSSDIRSGYAMDIKETFARFVDRFVGWTELLATGYQSKDIGWYNDKFTTSQFVQFARLLQEKAALDANGATRNVVPSTTRFSQKLTAENALQRQNEKLRADVEYWKGQTKRTTTPTARQADVDAAARDVVKYYGATVKAAEIAPAIKDLTEYIMRGGDDLTWGGVKERAYGIARDVIQSAKELREGDGGIYDEVRSALKRPMVISMQDAHDVSPEWGPWRNANRGKVNVSINGTGMPVDTVYAELSDKYPSLFPDDITHPADQVLRMAEIMDELAPVYANPYSYYMAEAIEECANDIIDRVLSDDIRQTPKTFADRAADKLAAEKARGAQKAAAVREQKNEQIARIKMQNAERAAAAIAKERAVRDEKIRAIKKHYADVKQAAQLRKADSAARTKLLNIAKRLNNRKMPAVSREKLNQYIGDLDLVSKGITGQTLDNLATLRDWYEAKSDKNSPSYDPDFLSDPATEEKIKRLSKKHIKDMTAQEVAELTEVLLNFENELRTEKQMIDSDDRRDTYQQGVDVIEDVKATKGSKGGPIDQYIVTETLSPVRAIHRYTGYNENDPLYLRTQELADGQRKMFDYQMRANKRFEKFLADKKFIDSLAGKNAQWIEITGYGEGGKPVTVKITPAMRMSLYLHSLNDQNLKHIRDGGVTIPDQKLYQQGKIAEAYAKGETIKLTPSAVRSIAAGMTEQERAFAQAAHDYFNGMSRDEINAVSEKLKGYSIAGVEDYFPINTDTAFTKSDFESLKFDGTLEGMGFLKERVNAKNPIMLRDMNDVLTQSINQHSKYVGLAIPVRNFNKVWGVTSISFNEDGSRNSFESSVQKAVGQKWGKDAVDYIEKMMTDLQNAGGHTESWDSLFSKIRSNYAQAVLTLNLSVAMKQAASYPTAAAVVGWAPLAKAMGNVGKVDLDLIAKYTPLQWYRSQGFSSQELGDMAKRGMKLPAALNWVQGIDLLTTRKLWKAAEYYVRQNNKALQVGSDAYYQEVADVYNRIIEETQPNYTTMQRPQLLRSDSTLMQNMAMFKTQPFQNFNVLYDAFGNLEAKKAAYQNSGTDEAKAEYKQAQKRAAWAAESQIVSLAVFAAMTFAWAHLRGKDDKYKDEDGNLTFESMMKGIGKNMLSGAMGMVPFGTEVYDLLASKLFGDKYYGIDAVTPSAISDFATALSNGGNAVWDAMKTAIRGGKVDWNDLRLKLESPVDAISKLLGIPEENVKNLFNLVYRQVSRRAAGKYAGEYAYLRLTADPEKKKSQYYDVLFAAYQNSPEQYNEIIQDMLDSGDFDEKKIKSEMDDRIKKAAGDFAILDIEDMYLLPDQQERYDDLMGRVSSNKIWKNATGTQQGKIQNNIYQLAQGSPSGENLKEKLDDAANAGVSESEYFLYQLALQIADAKNNANGNYDQDEAEAAIGMLTGLTKSQKSYLYASVNSGWKNNPYGDVPAAKTTTANKNTTKATTTTKTETNGRDTVDVSGSTAISAASYDPKTETVYITYKSNGKTYSYEGISQSEWERFKNSSSKGSYVRNWQ